MAASLAKDPVPLSQLWAGVSAAADWVGTQVSVVICLPCTPLPLGHLASVPALRRFSLPSVTHAATFWRERKDERGNE